MIREPALDEASPKTSTGSPQSHRRHYPSPGSAPANETAKGDTEVATLTRNDRTPHESAVVVFCRRHYVVLATLVLSLTAFNLVFRLDAEIVNEWDEALYAISAWEMSNSGDLIGTTFLGALDYYNTKPPLNVWLIAAAFKVLGRSLISLRLTSVVSAWLTVLLVQYWAGRVRGPVVGLLTGIVLSTTFGFIFLHAGRSAETDALFALLITLTAITLWVQTRRPAVAIWLGPLLAAAFLLRGMAFLMPLGIVVVTMARLRPMTQRILTSLLWAGVLFVLPVAAWSLARWKIDGWQFLSLMVSYDLVARSLTVIEEHPGNALYYFDVLHKHHYDWLVAGAAAWVLFPVSLHHLRRAVAFWRPADPFVVVLGSWGVICTLIPTLMRTKLPWYLNSFYPVFALGVAMLLARGLSSVSTVRKWRRTLLWVLTCVVFVTAEGKLAWNSYVHRDLNRSVQGLLLAARQPLAGGRVFRPDWSRSEIFVLGAIIGAERRIAGGLDMFLRDSSVGDYWVSSSDEDCAELVLLRSDGRSWLYRRER